MYDIIAFVLSLVKLMRCRLLRVFRNEIPSLCIKYGTKLRYYKLIPLCVLAIRILCEIDKARHSFAQIFICDIFFLLIVVYFFFTFFKTFASFERFFHFLFLEKVRRGDKVKRKSSRESKKRN